MSKLKETKIKICNTRGTILKTSKDPPCDHPPGRRGRRRRSIWAWGRNLGTVKSNQHIPMEASIDGLIENAASSYILGVHVQCQCTLQAPFTFSEIPNLQR